jgi:hypothetical protein
MVRGSSRDRLYPTLRERLSEHDRQRYVATLSELYRTGPSLPEPTIPEGGMSLAALRAVPPPSVDQLEALQMCHNAIVGHSGADRTITKLNSLAHN